MDKLGHANCPKRSARDRCKSPRAMPAGQYLMPHYDGRPPGARIPNRSRSLRSDEFFPSRIRPTQNGFWTYYGGPLSSMDKVCPIAAAQLRILATIGPCRFTITVTILASCPFSPPSVRNSDLPAPYPNPVGNPRRIEKFRRPLINITFQIRPAIIVQADGFLRK